MDYETEEQQVEALKAWWAENGKAVVAGVVLGVGAIGAWSLWQGYQERSAVAASDAWSRVEAAADAGDAATVESLAAELRDDHDGTLYAAYGNLAAARVAIEADDLDTAAERLAWVADEAVQDDVALIARVRLARVEGARGRAARRPRAPAGRLPRALHRTRRGGRAATCWSARATQTPRARPTRPPRPAARWPTRRR